MVRVESWFQRVPLLTQALMSTLRRIRLNICREVYFWMLLRSCRRMHSLSSSLGSLWPVLGGGVLSCSLKRLKVIEFDRWAVAFPGFSTCWSNRFLLYDIVCFYSSMSSTSTMNMVQDERNGSGAHRRTKDANCAVMFYHARCTDICCVFWDLFHPFHSIRLTPPRIKVFRVLLPL